MKKDKVNKNKLKGIYINCQYIFYILRLIFSYKKIYLIISILLSFVATGLPFLTILVSQKLINGLQTGDKTFDELVFIIFLYISIQILTVLSSLINTYFNNKYQEYLRCELNKYFDYLCSKLTLVDFEDSEIYDMLQRAENQIGVRPIYVLNNLISFFNGLFGLLFSIVILINWHSWIIIGFILLPIACFKYFKSITHIEYDTLYERAKIQREAWYLSYLITKDYNIKEVKSLGLKDFILNKKKSIQNKIYLENIRISKKKMIFKGLYQMLNMCFAFLVIFVALVETFTKKIFVGNFMTYINTTSRVEGFITTITDSAFSLYSDSLYCQNLSQFIEYAKSREDETRKKENLYIVEQITRIEIKNVSYKYKHSNTYALKNINLDISVGDIIVFVGENGSGKTTLIKLILGLYDDYEGQILINGIDLKQLNIKKYVEKISAIFQDYNNYEFDVADNIRFGNIKTENYEEMIKQAAMLTGADLFIEGLPNKYRQQVGNWFSGGVQLSGGQWQKLALSRGVFRNADVYIFDEPTAALDPSSEYNFFEKMLRIYKGKIGIFITHRFINAKLADKIYVLERGEIAESGSHEQLISLNGKYKKLYMLQINGISRENH